jgi:2-C-methyl-D-erythritol 4-phosphate cytidylyltransferase
MPPVPVAVATVVVAGGEGRRLRARVPKAFVRLRGRPLFLWSLERLAAVPGLVGQVLVLPPDRIAQADRWKRDFARLRVTAVVAGGARRQDSAAAGFRAIPADAKVVLVHDAARPLVRADDAARVAAAAAKDGAALLAAPVTDTLKREGDASRVRETVPRAGLWRAMTPQGFRREVYAAALEAVRPDDPEATDDAALAERAGVAPTLVPGDPWNLKVTTPEDLRTVEALLSAARPEGA